MRLSFALPLWLAVVPALSLAAPASAALENNDLAPRNLTARATDTPGDHLSWGGATDALVEIEMNSNSGYRAATISFKQASVCRGTPSSYAAWATDYLTLWYGTSRKVKCHVYWLSACKEGILASKKKWTFTYDWGTLPPTDYHFHKIDLPSRLEGHARSFRCYAA